MLRTLLAAAAIGVLLIASDALAQEFSISSDIEADPAQLADAQQDLGRIGFPAGTADGKFGPRSNAAFAAFLKQYGPELPPALTAQSRALLSATVAGWTGWPWDAAPAPARSITKV